MGEEQSVPTFQLLSMGQQQQVIALIGRMALRQIRSAQTIGEKGDDVRNCHGPVEFARESSWASP
ncbi:hypothetical protein AQZ50_18750 [Novosphingobium sp. Fuku2-ISO-50]|jgi:hypothetical protein|nr:hypothetical protein AQZ50_18750 [Novosphingobium sp. Fuku2-ISO-50]